MQEDEAHCVYHYSLARGSCTIGETELGEQASKYACICLCSWLRIQCVLSFCCLYFSALLDFNLKLWAIIHRFSHKLLFNQDRNKTMTGTEIFFCYYCYWCLCLVSLSPGWPHYIAEDDPEILIILWVPPGCWDYRWPQLHLAQGREQL